ncbi:glycerol-3-phosphate 1-O-acyltransferase PlsY [Mycoplasma sp. CSL10137]|uniref:glycerol-3-phosphate 1-O-acyltransferase PlsY n=1 Tax=Mycoplasma sp. CSL10137 TaxID=2813824 RepID=UPI00197C88AC|nr:glycerol-3-phosphate 1-O-acyltransferase PlsY [Mycoplasma sp. CSL10137]MBN4083605.1 glycerol-3-phosphate 1-O-acyltransferase PlsY [Mycoplasma sp. CSL10137]
MEIYLSILTNLLFVVIGYLVGSINLSILLGKYFFKKDLREFNSKNAGSTNARRVYGKFFGTFILVVDILKPIIVILLSYGISKLINNSIKINLEVSNTFESANKIYNELILIPTFGGFAVVLGHVFPVFHKFKGGKGVANFVGLMLSINVISFLVFVVIYFLVLYIKKYVSVASISASISSSVVLFIPWIITGELGIFNNISGINYYFIIPLISLFLASLITYSHKPNILRIKNKTEPKINF